VLGFSEVELFHSFVPVLQTVSGTGADGRIVSRDVLTAASSPAPTVAAGTSYSDLDLSNMRKVWSDYRRVWFILSNRSKRLILIESWGVAIVVPVRVFLKNHLI